MLESIAMEGESPVVFRIATQYIYHFLVSRALWDESANSGGKFHPRLNTNTRPIVNKYREGKVKRTLKRGLKVLEIVKGEANTAVDFCSSGLLKPCLTVGYV